ncbi:MAG: hypothetical protein IRZ28_08130 [Steroidobacteraceae bacterium]|nr:hypothetical protein [Steroidobacteraceae bacterium]
MSREGTQQPDEFEQRLRGALEDSVVRVNSRVRSRLNQARHAAIEEAAARPWFRRWPGFMPAAGALAATVLVVLLVTSRHHADPGAPVVENGAAGFEVIDLLTDAEALDLIENWDGGFYEWAAAQGESTDGTSG